MEEGRNRFTILMLAFSFMGTVTSSTTPVVLQSNITESTVTEYDDTEDQLTAEVSTTYPDDYDYPGYDVEYFNKLLKVYYGIYHYGMGTVIIVGVISNTMCVVVLQSNHFR